MRRTDSINAQRALERAESSPAAIPEAHAARPGRRSALLAGLFLMAPALRGKAPTADSDFRLRVRTIDSLFQRARKARERRLIELPVYSAVIALLREEELALYEEVRAHQFEDRSESDFWWRGRMKFPSELQTEQRLLSEGDDPAFRRN